MKKQKFFQGLLLIIIVIALGFVARQLRTGVSTSAATYDRIMVDIQANKIFIQPTVVSAPAPVPADSPFSAGKNAYPAFKCMKDGTIFAYEEPSLSPGSQQVGPRCPVCGGSDIMPPQLPAGQKSIDITGPVQTVKPTPVS